MTGAQPSPPSPPLDAGFLADIERAVLDREGILTGGEIRFRCPGEDHEDTHPSARWNAAKGVWCCDVCKRGGGAIDLAQRLGVPLPERPAPIPISRARSRPVATYPYVDASGDPLFRVVRTDPKGFYQQHPDGRGGWTNGLGSVQPVLYRLPEVLAADDIVVVVEGERDADRLHGLGVVATTAPMGAGRWRNGYATVLAGKDVVILPDNDAVGRAHGDQVAASIHRVAASVHVVPLPGLPDKGDVSDWLDAGGTIDDLARLIAETPLWSPAADETVPAAPREVVPAESDGLFVTARMFAAQTPPEVAWIAPPWVARGAITELSGKIKSAGKTTFTLALCRAVLDGAPFLGRTAVQGPIVYLTEQPPASFREALDRAGLLDAEDFHILQWHQTASFAWSDVVLKARHHARAVGAVLLVVDTLPQFAGLRGDAENSSGAALEAISPLQQALADDLGVLIIRHDRKGGGEVGDSARGSSAFGGAVDVVLQLQRPEGNSRPTLRVINALSRFSATPDQLMIELTDDGYRALGDKGAVALDEARRTIIAAAPTTEAEALSEKELLEAAETKRTVGQEALRLLRSEHVLARLGEGKRGDPYRFWRPPETVAAATPSLSAAESNGHRSADTGKASAATTGAAAETNGRHVWACEGCGQPRALERMPCPSCGEVAGRWEEPPVLSGRSP